MQPTDEQLQTWCRRLKGSDQQAYERVFRALHENLFWYALHITGEDRAARDMPLKRALEKLVATTEISLA